MKVGYDPIPHQEGDADNGNSLAGISRANIVQWKKVAVVAAAVFVIALAPAIGFFRWRSQRAVSEAAATPLVVIAPEDDKSVLIRPFCQSHGGFKPRILQTSMKQPNQQWTDILCLTEPEKKPKLPFLNGRQEDDENYLNTYGSPDAILQVNFSQIAHPERKVPILGFGGAFTEASGLNFQRLSKKGQDTVMELLFGKSGLGYAIGRVHINSCDFSIQSYSFDETVDDFQLQDFDLGVRHDVETGMVGMALQAVSILRANWASEDGQDGNLFLYASPWSPPAWMKNPTWEDYAVDPNATTAHKMTYSSEYTCLKEGVGPTSRYAQAWALYFSKFLRAYRDLGLPLKAVTVQNEPEFPAPWEACSYTPNSQNEFITYHLGPQLAQDHPGVKILAFDHNKDHVNTWIDALLNRTSSAAPYVAGTAYHWYAGGMDRLLDGALGIPNMHRLQDRLKTYGVKAHHIVLGSESCHCPTTGYAGGDINIYWSRAERYAHTILADLAAGSNGWVEWNLILDGIGGPNHLGNLCEAMLLAVPHRALDVGEDFPPLPDFEKQGPMGNVSVGDGRTREELDALGFPAKYLDVGVAVQPMYFYMGHISRYVRPGSLAVMGLVQESVGPGRIFRREGSVVTGGGQNDLARLGIELTVWPCEGSTRQQFKWNLDHHKHIRVFGHDWLGKPTVFCVGRSEDKDFLGLRLTSCDSLEDEAGSFDVIPLPDDDQGRYLIKLLNPVRRKTMRLCLVIRELHNNGGAYGPRGGAQVTLGDCEEDESAKWFVNRETGEASSNYFADDDDDSPNLVCMTTGWPFLQMGAFLTPNGEAPKTVVILNEANDPANFAIKDNGSIVLTASIPPRSIQTVLLE